MEKMVVRQPADKMDNLHPDAKKKYNAMMQTPEPLVYKLHEWPIGEAKEKIDTMIAIHKERFAAGEIEELPENSAA